MVQPQLEDRVLTPKNDKYFPTYGFAMELYPWPNPPSIRRSTLHVPRDKEEPVGRHSDRDDAGVAGNISHANRQHSK